MCSTHRVSDEEYKRRSANTNTQSSHCELNKHGQGHEGLHCSEEPASGEINQ